MPTGKSVMLFAALIYAYVIVSAWAACFWEGPRTSSAFDPHPFRSTARFIGMLGMVLCLGAKLAARFLFD